MARANITLTTPGSKGDVGITWKGNFAAQTAYNIRDIIRDSSTGTTANNLYICVSAVSDTTFPSGSTPENSLINTDYFQLFIDGTSASFPTVAVEEAYTNRVAIGNLGTTAVSSAIGVVGDSTYKPQVEAVAIDLLYDQDTDSSTNSKINKVGVDLILGVNSKVDAVGTSLLLGDSSPIKKVSDAIGNVNSVGDDLALGATSKISIVSTTANMNSITSLASSLSSGDLATIADITGAISSVAAAEDDSNKVSIVGTNIANVNFVGNDLDTSDGVGGKIATVSSDLNGSNNIGAVAALDDEITLLGTATVTQNLSILGTTTVRDSINTVAGQISPTNNISTVAGANANITTISTGYDGTGTTSGTNTNLSLINNVGGSIGNVNTVADKATDITTLATGKDGTTSTSGDNLNILQIDTVADKISEVDSVAGQISPTNNIATVAGQISPTNNIATVAGINTTHLSNVSGNADEIGRLGTADAVVDMGLLADQGIIDDMGLLADTTLIGNMNLLGVQAVVDNIAALAPSSVRDDMAALAPSGVRDDMAALGDTTTVASMNEIGTSVNVANMATLSASGVVDNIATVAGVDEEVGRLGTVEAASDLSDLGTTANVSNMSKIATGYDGTATTSGTSTNLALVNTVAGGLVNINAVAGYTSLQASDISNAAENADDAKKLAINAEDSQFTLSSINGSTTGYSTLHYYNKTSAKATIVNAKLLGTANDANMPTTADTGAIIYNSTEGRLKVYSGSSWTSVTDTAKISRTGDGMTGTLTLATAATGVDHATRKDYVDSQATAMAIALG